MNNTLEGNLVYKGEQGLSAYELAVQDGFVGTLQDWLATLGTASHFEECSEIYTATGSQAVFPLPDCYINDSYVEVYVEGVKRASNTYTVDPIERTVTLNVAVTEGQIVEVITLTMTTNSLPITETINAESTNETAAGTKAVYDLVNSKIYIDDTTVSKEKAFSSEKVNGELLNIKTTLGKKATIEEVEKIINDDEMSTESTYSSSKIMLDMVNKMEISNFKTLTGSISSIAVGSSKTADIEYPTGFNKNNTIIISKMCSSNNTYYDAIDSESTASGFPKVTMVALTDDVIRVWMKNDNGSEARNGYYKLTIMKVM